KSGTARTAAASRLTTSRKSTIPRSAHARPRPRRAASRITGEGSSSEQGLQLQEVLEPERPAHRPLGRGTPRHREVVVEPGVVGGLDVERDPAERVHVRPAHLRRPVVPEARPAVLPVPALVDHAAVRELDADLDREPDAAEALHDHLGVERTLVVLRWLA